MAAPSPALEEFQKLAKEKDALEAEIKGLHEYLTEEGMPGVSGSLIDEEGFPRGDLDLYAIRKARNRLACAQTDHMEVMKKIEKALVLIHSGSCVSVPRATPAPCGDQEMDDAADTAAPAEAQAVMPSPPFALIDEVAEGSPAQAAGLVLGDQICSFGGISRLDTGDLNACFAAIQQLVPRSAGTALEVIVLRGNPPARVPLQLTPRQWAGRGLLGCHMAPKTE
mmetsp:Transcript_64598/g.185819  ORF Transcript_64598/g.185819 Transcript_64598/m.185819 type:complete len:224 (-) Transcript_64598:88-759(-)|eukprot:CAMPEP_0177197420 /NCGR_PEP_ID=MMETSP0367-20130122/24570_1 /TAXON_ID=447022 ORGANISM="Scrippsiella hangoei-like, Strain SHHI-4" /NCGR_SAMPLE_ID=MMETSP0367 /ASSEMBLY_ACC=CAM_ASM_000362 /LENGTH=223 /DNA_ID=CAMNT_0018645579 /DNA_START=55 /DNA_END=726 /DNA_ORIENTATION=+